MKIVVVEKTPRGQTFYQRKIEQLRKAGLEAYQIDLHAITPDQVSATSVQDFDIALIGSGLHEEALPLCHEIRSHAPWIQVLQFVSSTDYLPDAFINAYAAGVRKIFTDQVERSDLIQELIAIRLEHCRQGRAHEAKVVLLLSAKGGAGVTSITSALGDICSAQSQKVLLWDLDIETHDLTRSLHPEIRTSAELAAWIRNTSPLTPESLDQAVVKFDDTSHLLPPPRGMAEALDLVCHPDGSLIAERVIEFARVAYDTVLIDAGGVFGPSLSTLINLADKVVLVIGDSALGLTGVDAYLQTVVELNSQKNKLAFVCSRSSFSLKQIQATIDPDSIFGDECWRLPKVPVDHSAYHWLGSGQTFFRQARSNTKTALSVIAQQLRLVSPLDLEQQNGITYNSTQQKRHLFNIVRGWISAPSGATGLLDDGNSQDQKRLPAPAVLPEQRAGTRLGLPDPQRELPA